MFARRLLDPLDVPCFGLSVAAIGCIATGKHLKKTEQFNDHVQRAVRPSCVMPGLSSGTML